MSDLCPESEYRASLSDEDFWPYVLQGIRPEDPHPEPELPEWPDEPQMAPCPECGERGACAYDEQGRALIHATEGEAS